MKHHPSTRGDIGTRYAFDDELPDDQWHTGTVTIGGTVYYGGIKYYTMVTDCGITFDMHFIDDLEQLPAGDHQ